MFSSTKVVLRTLSPSLPSTSRSLSSIARPSPTVLLTSSSPRRPSSAPRQHLARRSLVLHAAAPDNPPEDAEDGSWEDLVPAGERTVDVTESALAQIAKAQRLAKDPKLALRVAVESGGCHGYQYAIAVTNTRELDDFLFSAPPPPLPTPSKSDSDTTTTPFSDVRILIDSASLPLLSGSTLDYSTELIGSQFKIRNNPHANEKGGCGCGVSWELKA